MDTDDSMVKVWGGGRSGMEGINRGTNGTCNIFNNKDKLKNKTKKLELLVLPLSRGLELEIELISVMAI